MKRLTSLIIPLLFALGTQAQSTVVVEDHAPFKALGESFQLIDDKEAVLSPEQALEAEGIQVDRDVPNLGFAEGYFWLKTSVKRASANAVRLQVNQPILDEVSLFLFKNGKLVDSVIAGENYPFKERMVRDPYFVFNLDLAQGEEATVLLRIKSEEQIVLPIYLTDTATSNNQIKKRDLLFGGYFGLILVMALYNLFIFISVRDKSYLFYVFYIILVGITQAVLEGYTFQYLWPNWSWFASRSVYVFSSSVSIFSIIFLQIFLDTKHYTPKLHRLAIPVYTLLGLTILLTLIDVNKVSHNLAQVSIGLVSFYIFLTSYQVYRSGYRPARFFFIAWLILVIGIFLFVLKDAGLIPVNAFTNYTLQVGSAIEVLLLSFALADRINILKKEKEASQEEALRVSLENERIIREQNAYLEQKVQERTIELQETNEELVVTLNNLKETQAQLVDAEKMASLGQLTAGIAHEINNPINFVSANVQPLRLDIQDIMSIIDQYGDAVKSDDVQEAVKGVEAFKKEIDFDYIRNEIVELLTGIEDGAIRTSEIVKGLKTFSRLDESDLKPADLNEGLQSTLVLLRNSIPDNVEVETELDDLPPVECFPGKINQIFMNIVSNAVQAMKGVQQEEKHHLQIKSYFDEKNVYFSIKDSGPGMTDEIKSRIFEPFFTTKDVGEGTGLGLSIVFKIIETHGGHIDVKTSIGEGTEFIITLPIVANIQTN